MAICEICGDEEARYVCSSCGKSAGVRCFISDGWLCRNCAKPETPSIIKQPYHSLTIASSLLMIAFIMIFAGLILLAFSSSQAGGFIIVFPFFFASSNGSIALILPAIAITVIMIILAYLSLRRSERT